MQHLKDYNRQNSKDTERIPKAGTDCAADAARLNCKSCNKEQDGRKTPRREKGASIPAGRKQTPPPPPDEQNATAVVTMRPNAAETLLESDAGSKDSLGSGHVLGAQAVYRLLRQLNVLPHLSRTAETNRRVVAVCLSCCWQNFGGIPRGWSNTDCCCCCTPTNTILIFVRRRASFGLRLANTCGTLLVYREAGSVSKPTLQLRVLLEESRGGSHTPSAESSTRTGYWRLMPSAPLLSSPLQLVTEPATIGYTNTQSGQQDQDSPPPSRR